MNTMITELALDDLELVAGGDHTGSTGHTAVYDAAYAVGSAARDVYNEIKWSTDDFLRSIGIF